MDKHETPKEKKSGAKKKSKEKDASNVCTALDSTDAPIIPCKKSEKKIFDYMFCFMYVCTQEKKRKKKQMQKSQLLQRLNTAAFVLHLLTFVASLIVTLIFAPQSFQTQLTVDFRVYGNDTLSIAAPPPVQAGPFATKLQSLGYYQLIWVNLAFPLVTAIFHALIAFEPYVRKQYNDWVFLEGINPLRWIEYSFTASEMTWVIMQLSGITNIFLLVMLGIVCNVALQCQGYLMEVLNKKPATRVQWAPMLCGWLIFMGQWAVIFSYFFEALASPRPSTAMQVPWFVYTIVIGLFFQFALFGLVQVFRYASFTKTWFGGFFKGFGYEISYIVLSATSKIFLVLNLLIGMAINQMSSA
ncbi:MAG: heliorhodopsin HeR [Nitrosomonas sp.]|nr:heliorhodopsin HeR [Nitrosomonas sp.]